VLSLLSDAAAEQPVLCLIDDAQWLDRTSAQLLAFVARRLEAESVAMIFGTCHPGAVPGVAGLPQLSTGICVCAGPSVPVTTATVTALRRGIRTLMVRTTTG